MRGLVAPACWQAQADLAIAGVGAAIGRHVMITPTALRWLKSLAAILLGNALYFALNPHLPPPAQYNPRQLIGLGTVIDFWFCLLVYGLLELGALLLKLRKR